MKRKGFFVVLVFLVSLIFLCGLFSSCADSLNTEDSCKKLLSKINGEENKNTTDSGVFSSTVGTDRIIFWKDGEVTYKFSAQDGVEYTISWQNISGTVSVSVTNITQGTLNLPNFDENGFFYEVTDSSKSQKITNTVGDVYIMVKSTTDDLTKFSLTVSNPSHDLTVESKSYKYSVRDSESYAIGENLTSASPKTYRFKAVPGANYSVYTYTDGGSISIVATGGASFSETNSKSNFSANGVVYLKLTPWNPSTATIGKYAIILTTNNDYVETPKLELYP